MRRNIPPIRRFISSSSLDMAMNLHRDETTKKAHGRSSYQAHSGRTVWWWFPFQGQGSRHKRDSTDLWWSDFVSHRQCQVTVHKSTVWEGSAIGTTCSECLCR